MLARRKYIFTHVLVSFTLCLYLLQIISWVRMVGRLYFIELFGRISSYEKQYSPTRLSPGRI